MNGILTFIYKLISHIQLKLFKKNIYYGYGGKKEKKALLYYKNEVLFAPLLARLYTHTNDWELIRICDILVGLGFSVDVIGRNISKADIDTLKDEYDFFMGNSAGNSGKFYLDIAKKLKRAKKVFFAAGQSPEFSNKKITERYDRFESLHGSRPSYMRMRDIGDTKPKLELSDAVFCICNAGGQATYKEIHDLPIHRILPSSSPLLTFDEGDIQNRESKNFLYFGGNGALVKGLDILIDTFLISPEINLHICGPVEKDILKVYRDQIIKSKNIFMHGFVIVGSDKFNNLTSMCPYIVLASSTEGTATGVTTCMRKGLIPVVTPESGIDIHDFGFMINSIEKNDLRKQLLGLSKMDKEDIKERSLKSYEESKKYTQEGFTRSFEEGLRKII